MSIKYLTVEETEHPLRREFDEEHLAMVIQGILDDDNWMTMDEIIAAQDLLFDRIIAEKQTVEGCLTVH